MITIVRNPHLTVNWPISITTILLTTRLMAAPLLAIRLFIMVPCGPLELGSLHTSDAQSIYS